MNKLYVFVCLLARGVILKFWFVSIGVDVIPMRWQHNSLELGNILLTPPLYISNPLLHINDIVILMDD